MRDIVVAVNDTLKELNIANSLGVAKSTVYVFKEQDLICKHGHR